MASVEIAEMIEADRGHRCAELDLAISRQLREELQLRIAVMACRQDNWSPRGL